MRHKIILAVVFFAYLLIIIRVFQLSVLKHDYYEKFAEKNIHKKIYVKPIRGIIYDRNNNPIAYNELRFALLIKPHLKDNELNKTIDYVSKYLKIDKKKVYKEYKKQNSWYNHKYIDVLDYIENKEIYANFPLLIQNKNVKIESSYLRIYPEREILSHVLGYVGKANRKEVEKNKELKYIKITGKSGIEKQYNKQLTGKLGYIDVIINAKNRIIKEVKKIKPSSSDIKLNIDVHLQKFIFNLLKEEDKKGSVVVMDTKGRIFAMVNYPSYDNNLFVKGISVKEWKKIINDNFRPFLNKAIAGLYPPGSVVKPSIGLIALASGRIGPHQKLWCPAYIEVSNRKFRDWKKEGHGWTDMVKAIKRSADTYFYQIGLMLGVDYIAKNLKRMGYGKKTGIDLPNERSGIIPNKEWKQKRYHQSWFIGETLNTSIGQGYVLVTPLQVAVNTALLATGKLPIPQIIYSIDNKTIPPKQKDILTKREKSFLPFIRQGMWEVCNSPGGTAKNHLEKLPFEIAGKTGTAQVHSIPQDVKERKREDELAYWKRSHAWLTTFGPYSNPQFVVTAVIEHGGHGGSAAGGIISKIYKKLYELHYIKINKQTEKENEKKKGKK